VNLSSRVSVSKDIGQLVARPSVRPSVRPYGRLS